MPKYNCWCSIGYSLKKFVVETEDNLTEEETDEIIKEECNFEWGYDEIKK